LQGGGESCRVVGRAAGWWRGMEGCREGCRVVWRAAGSWGGLQGGEKGCRVLGRATAGWWGGPAKKCRHTHFLRFIFELEFEPIDENV